MLSGRRHRSRSRHCFCCACCTWKTMKLQTLALCSDYLSLCFYIYVYTCIHIYNGKHSRSLLISLLIFSSSLLFLLCFSFAPFSHLNGGPLEQKYQRNKNVMNLFSVIVECSHDETQWKKKLRFRLTSIGMIYFLPACCSSRTRKWLILWTKNKNPSKKVSKF